MAEPIILASASAARARLLKAVGVEFTVQAAAIDENLRKSEARRAGVSAVRCALALAAEKASVVSRRNPNALVIGADQLLAAGTEWFDKPRDTEEARRQLLVLRGRTHTLATAVCVAQAGETLWRAASEPELQMRWFSEAFLDAYIVSEGESLRGSVGAYRLEGRGVQLFARISGDYFAIMGLPLIELLGFLRGRGGVLQ